MGKLRLLHPEAKMKELKARADERLRNLKPFEQRWAITLVLRSGEKRRCYGGKTREECLANIQALFETDDEDIYEMAWARRVDLQPPSIAR